MIEATCHCGAARLSVHAAPAEVTDCNCSVCRRYGVLWAYYPRDAVVVPAAGSTEAYARGASTIDFHRCRRCGCVTHWYPRDARDRIGVNARLLDRDVLRGVRVRHLDGADTERYID